MYVYTMQTEEEHRLKTPVNNYYWEDSRFTAPRGPFGTLWDCCRNWVTMCEVSFAATQQTLLSPPPPPPMNNVIHVDFKAKKRVKA